MVRFPPYPGFSNILSGYNGNALFFVQPGNSKADIILLARGAQVVAGMGNRIDSVKYLIKDIR